MLKRPKLFDPWSMSITHECRLSAFWQRRFAALGTDRRQLSRWQMFVAVSLLVLLIVMPTLRLGSSHVAAQDTKAPTTTIPLGAQVFSDTQGAIPAVPPILPRAKRKWQIIDTPELKQAMNRITIMVGETLRIDMVEGCKSSTRTPGLFSVKNLPQGDVEIVAKKSGVGVLSHEFDNGKKLEMKVVVVVDPKLLEGILRCELSEKIRVTPTVQGVILTGQLSSTRKLNCCIEIAETMFPLVVNNIQLDRQQVLLRCRVFEFSADLGEATKALEALLKAKEIWTEDGHRIALLDEAAFDETVEVLRKSGDVRVLATPTVTTLDECRATVHIGGEFPVVVPNAKDLSAIEYKQFGTTIDFVPIVISDSRLRLEVRQEIAQIDNDKSTLVDGVRVPHVSTRRMETAAEMNVDQTLVIAMIGEDTAKNGKQRCVVTMIRPSYVDAVSVAEFPVLPKASTNQR